MMEVVSVTPSAWSPWEWICVQTFGRVYRTVVEPSLSQDDLVPCEQPMWSRRKLWATEDFCFMKVSRAKNSKYEQTDQILLKLGLLWSLVASGGDVSKLLKRQESWKDGRWDKTSRCWDFSDGAGLYDRVHGPYCSFSKAFASPFIFYFTKPFITWSHGGVIMCSVPHIGKKFSRSVMFDFLWPHGLQHTRPPCPSPTPWACSNSCPSSRWCHPTISSSVALFSSWLSSSHQVAKVLEFQLQHQSFQWIFRTISFRIDWFDLLAVQGTLKQTKALILCLRYFFREQEKRLHNFLLDNTSLPFSNPPILHKTTTVKEIYDGWNQNNMLS